MGDRELAIQLQRDVLGPLEEAGVKLYLVTIGPGPRGFEFSELTGFPTDRLLADPESTTYAALGLYKSLSATFFQRAVRCPLLDFPALRLAALWLSTSLYPPPKKQRKKMREKRKKGWGHGWASFPRQAFVLLQHKRCFFMGPGPMFLAG